MTDEELIEISKRNGYDYQDIEAYNGKLNKEANNILEELTDQEIYDKDAESITLSTFKTKLAIGERAYIAVEPDPSITNVPNVFWETNDSSIAYMISNGTIVALNEGEVTVTATDVNNPEVFGTLDFTIYDPNQTKDDGGDDSGDDSGDDGGDDGGDETVIVKPEPTENTEQEQQVQDEVANALTDEEGGTAAYSAAYENINNLTIPSDSLRSATISGSVQNGATITNESTGKYITLTNTNEEPTDVNVITSGGAVYLRGEYDDIYLEGNALKVSSSTYPNVHGTVSVADTDQPVSLTLNFVGEDCGVNYLGEKELTISDGVADVLGSPTIYAPNASVKMGGKYDEVTATVSTDTLILNNGFHANKLTILKGNIFVNGIDINDFVDELVTHDDCVITYAEYHVTQDSNSKLMSSSPANGKIILDTDIELTKGRAYSALASGKEVVDLNGHIWRCGDTRATDSNLGSYYLRGGNINVTLMDSVGGGVFENNHADYLIFTNGANVVVNVMSGEYRGYTHTLYSLLGTINVYGGTFKLLDAETAERDANGNLKFLLNCYDANYTAGTAKINVYGGKFYEFNPAVTYGEPGSPVSYVAPGYHVVETIEDGIKVYEVLAD